MFCMFFACFRQQSLNHVLHSLPQETVFVFLLFVYKQFVDFSMKSNLRTDLLFTAY